MLKPIFQAIKSLFARLVQKVVDKINKKAA